METVTVMVMRMEVVTVAATGTVNGMGVPGRTLPRQQVQLSPALQGTLFPSR